MKTKPLMPILIAIFAIALLSGTKVANAISTLHVAPSLTADPALISGSSFTISINITNVANLAGVEFKLMYDPSLLMGLGVSGGSFWVDGFSEWVNMIDPSGFVWYSVTIPAGSTTGISGNGTIATIDFLVIGTGSSYMTLYDVLMGDPFANQIPYNLAHGLFSNVGTTLGANLVQRSAWPEAHHYVISNDAPAAGDGLITFNAKLSNIGTILTNAKVIFSLYDAAGVPLPGPSPEAGPYLIQPGQTIIATYDWGGFEPNQKYHVVAQAWYDSNGDFIIDAAGTKEKSFSFAVVP